MATLSELIEAHEKAAAAVMLSGTVSGLDEMKADYKALLGKSEDASPRYDFETLSREERQALAAIKAFECATDEEAHLKAAYVAALT